MSLSVSSLSVSSLSLSLSLSLVNVSLAKNFLDAAQREKLMEKEALSSRAFNQLVEMMQVRCLVIFQAPPTSHVLYYAVFLFTCSGIDLQFLMVTLN